MATQKQILANQSNAQRSSGPTSIEGRAIVAKNPLKHGVFSKQVLLNSESKEEFEILCAQLYAYFKPQNFLEQLLCERAVAAAWRLARVTKMETILINQSAKTSLLDRGITEVFTENYGHELALLSRYEITLEKILFRSLGELRALQATRKIEQAIQIDEIGFVPQKILDLNI